MLRSPRDFQAEIEKDRLPAPHARLAYLLTVLNSPFCSAFDTIVKVLLTSITSDQAKVRSRSLKSVVQMLERDPHLLDRDDTVMALILRCAADTSPMVRDSALSLIAKCIALQPKLEEIGVQAILACSSDQTTGVRKRCILLLRDLYLSTQRRALQTAIAENLLARTADYEDSVAVLARQALEDIWLIPAYSSIKGDTAAHTAAEAKVSLNGLVDQIVACVRQNDMVGPQLGAFLRDSVGQDLKGASNNFAVCKSVVATIFERVIEDTEAEGSQALLTALTVFAKANAKLFTPEQLETLHPYINHLATAEDLLFFRSVVIIYRCVLPHLTTSHDMLLKQVQNDLFRSIAKLARTELNEVMACLWTIDHILNNTVRLFKLLVSVLKGTRAEAATDFSDPGKAGNLNKAKSYIRIAGCVGKHCDLEKFHGHLKQEFPGMAVPDSVAALVADLIAPFAVAPYPLDLRAMALESLGGVCQTWPAQFSRPLPRKAFSCVFQESTCNTALQAIVFRAFLGFFSIHEGKTEKLVDTEGAAETSESSEDTTRFGGSLRASDNDGAAAIIAQNWLSNMLDAALSPDATFALAAFELLASINRQGLIHPKECAGVLVSLETSPDPRIAKLAFETHQMLHSQHESMFDREYMRAVQEAFRYQRDVFGEPNGAIEVHHEQAPSTSTFRAKLAPLLSIVNTSNAKFQKKFLANLCSKVNFDVKELDVTQPVPEHLLLARFICQNLAFFEYAQYAELMVVVESLERLVATTGDQVHQIMEAELFLPATPPPPPPQESAPQPAASQVLQVVEDSPDALLPQQQSLVRASPDINPYI
ncbi:Sister chromatid cohesion protein 2 [Ascosphaera acerosa]|nr:Sister chromatid cohesion protein 2 [Ascosphaera acerosa]